MVRRSATGATAGVVDWLLQSDEPWTRYRVLVDLLDRPADDFEVAIARAEMLVHPAVETLVDAARTWPHAVLVRHNDAAHPLHKLTVLADFGLRADDPGIGALAESVMASQSAEGSFQTVVNVPVAFGGSGRDQWSWLACDAPVVLHFLLAIGMGDDERVRRAVDHLVALGTDNGWRCAAARELGRFRGPGRRGDPCPIANVYALKALSLAPDWRDDPAVGIGVECLLGLWQRRRQEKPYLFGMGTDFRKPKYPFVWYDILHVLEVLSRFPAARADPRFGEMLDDLTAWADSDGHYTAASAYQAWRGWSFADKKQPSPWLTFLALRVLKRAGRWP